jgi:hypothetical protein
MRTAARHAHRTGQCVGVRDCHCAGAWVLCAGNLVAHELGHARYKKKWILTSTYGLVTIWFINFYTIYLHVTKMYASLVP